MQKVLIITFLSVSLLANAQTELHNLGNMYIHPDANLGIHTDVYNQGNLTALDNSLIGFYGETPNLIEGNQPLNLYDVAFANENGSFLNVLLNIKNNANFISSNVISPAMNGEAFLHFLENSFFTGPSDTGKVIGYVSIENKQVFSFPIGNAQLLRPLLLDSDNTNSYASCAYFYQNPSNPFAITDSFDTSAHVNTIGAVSEQEFWILNGEQPSQITVGWNGLSFLLDIAVELEDIVLVGWEKTSQQWTIIGNEAISGNINEGFLISKKFIPDNYGAITFGTTPLPTDTFATNYPTLGNYFVSPNGDGINDVLSFDDWDQIEGRNVLHIYNRFGQKVYTKENYLNNEFNGFSNLDNFVIKREEGLPDDIYYYTVSLPDMDLNYQGFFYLKR